MRLYLIDYWEGYWCYLEVDGMKRFQILSDTIKSPHCSQKCGVSSYKEQIIDLDIHFPHTKNETRIMLRTNDFYY